MTTTQVNGPINAVRLEGKVNNINKIMYLFINIAGNITYETECHNFLADDIHKHILKIVRNNKNITYDLLFEITPTDIQNNVSIYGMRYYDKMRDLFQQEFNFDYEHDKTKPTKSTPNLRLHYVDIRYPIEMDTWKLYNKLKNLVLDMKNNNYIDEQFIGDLLAMLQRIQNNIQIVYNIYFSKQKGGKNMFDMSTPTRLDDLMVQILSKIQKSYENKHVMETLVPIFNEMLQNAYTYLTQKYDAIIKLIEEIKQLKNPTYTKHISKDKSFVYTNDKVKKSTKNLLNLLNSYCDTSDIFFANIMDIYFLRRFLDKVYVTNCIAYTGMYHASVYIYVLVKYFGFNITHIVHSDVKDIKKLNDNIRKYKCPSGFVDIDFYFQFLPDQLQQCVDLKDFPKNLT